ncbi:MAG: tRNA (N6-isopentenyl adenosine(37)-C2)-methylthiotransferase MiaB [Armatimonadia bacterium]
MPQAGMSCPLAAPSPLLLCYNRRTMSDCYYLDTMGCQMNERDSETIAGLLESLGLHRTESMTDAKVVVLNTCAVREKPEHKVFSKLGDVRKLKQQRPDMVVVVAGCVAQIAHEEIRRRAPFVDVIVGPRNLSGLTEAIRRSTRPAQILANEDEVIPEALAVCRVPGVAAFVNVSYGCNNFCAYCIVPYARGREQSRAPEAVLGEVKQAVADGYREITLLGQNVNSYQGLDETDFASLLRLVAEVPGLARLRFTTSHPKDLSERLLDTMAELGPLCEHLHLPIQAGDDEVLHRMGRGYTYSHYKSLVEAARSRMPGLAITTDVMVGFPGETEEQFLNTLRAFEEIRYDQAFMFKYSDRPGTRAALATDKVPEAVKQDRLERLVAVQNTISHDINEALVGRDFEVLVEGPDPKSPGKLRGRTRTNKLMIFEAADEDLRGKLVTVRAERGYLWGFTGRLPD